MITNHRIRRQKGIVMDTKWQPDLSDFDGPKYLALAHRLRHAVRSGELPEGKIGRAHV